MHLSQKGYCLFIVFFSVKVPDNRLRQSCNEQSRASTSAAGSGNTQDPRKKTSELARLFLVSHGCINV